MYHKETQHTNQDQTLKSPPWLEARASAKALMDFLDASPTAFQATFAMQERLKQAGFKQYTLSELDNLVVGTRGYLAQNDSALIAFVIGKNPSKGWRVFGAHTDSPGLKIKPNPIVKAEGSVKLGVEVYGGPLLATWFDRPLSFAGRALVKTEGGIKSVLVKAKGAPLIIPNIAIHLNHEANNGVKIERHKVLLPIMTADNEAVTADFFNEVLAYMLDVSVTDILSYDLYLCDTTPACYTGFDDVFISSGRLDNLAMCDAGLHGLLTVAESDQFEGIAAVLFSDNEEVGSTTAQGADSLFARDTFELIAIGAGLSRAEFISSFASSIMLSADLAHAVHPNYGEMADPNHRPHINCGPVVKVAASQSYATDGKGLAIFKDIATRACVPVQTFVNRSDLRGGSTIGPISSSLMPMTTIDCGSPIWGMHSIRETGGVLDHYYMKCIAEAFFAY